jgi:hypothetical protein
MAVASACLGTVYSVLRVLISKFNLLAMIHFSIQSGTKDPLDPVPIKPIGTFYARTPKFVPAMDVFSE